MNAQTTFDALREVARATSDLGRVIYSEYYDACVTTDAAWRSSVSAAEINSDDQAEYGVFYDYCDKPSLAWEGYLDAARAESEALAAWNAFKAFEEHWSAYRTATAPAPIAEAIRAILDNPMDWEPE